jgi:hypothetical protein
MKNERSLIKSYIVEETRGVLFEQYSLLSVRKRKEIIEEIEEVKSNFLETTSERPLYGALDMRD